MIEPSDEVRAAASRRARHKAGESLDAIYGDDGIGGFSSWECYEADLESVCDYAIALLFLVKDGGSNE